MEEKVFLILWGWGQKKNGDHWKAQMGLGELDFRSSGRGVNPPAAYLSPKKELSLGYQGVPAGVGRLAKAVNWGRKVRRDDLWDLQDMGAGTREDR